LNGYTYLKSSEMKQMN